MLLPPTSPLPRPLRPGRVAVLALASVIALTACGHSAGRPTAASGSKAATGHSGTTSAGGSGSTSTTPGAPGSPTAGGSTGGGGATPGTGGSGGGSGGGNGAATTPVPGGGGSVASGGCATSALALTVGNATTVGGRSNTTDYFTNISTAACTLTGYPGVTGVGADGKDVAGPSTQDPRLAGVTGAPGTVTLQPGDRAQFTTGTAVGAAATGCPTGGYPIVALDVFPPGQTDPVRVSSSGSVCDVTTGFVVASS